MKTFSSIVVPSAIIAALGAWSLAAQAASDQSTAPPGEYMAPGLSVPGMDPVRGKKMFASKGCVVCHSINGVGGEDASKLDASTMQPVMNPFDFFAKMWRGAAPMIMMQQDEIGHQIQFTGQDLADIVAFVHNPAVQRTFTEGDIPAEIAEHMEEHHESGSGMMGDHGMTGGHGMMGGGQGMMGGGQKP